MSELSLLAAIVAGVTFVGQLRRGDARQRGYVLTLAAVLLTAVVAALQVDRFWTVVAVSLVTLVVIVPWVLDLLVRACFAREWLARAVRLAGLRAMLMPGAGLARQQAILQGLAVLERRGVDGALSYFRSLAHQTDDDGELRIIHEQIVSMLLFGQRWSESIAHYEARFPQGYAAHRPPLALGLLRAYGESGKLDDAAGLLQAIEEQLGRDPRAISVVSQARLTFLAYAGQSELVASALTDERRRRLGLSAASGALFRGIALSRAGRSNDAEVELRSVEDLATARDDRVVRASRSAITELQDDPVDLEPELRTYADRVADRLELFLRATPSMRQSGTLWVTSSLLLVLGAGYVAQLGLDGGGAGLLRLGAVTPELLFAGSWGRLLTGMFVQTDAIGLLLAIYGIWLAGPLVERLYGRARVLLTALGASAVGLAVACALSSEPAALYGGGTLMTTGLVCAALTVLMSARINLPRRTRRVLALPLILLLLALVVMIPRERGLELSAFGMIAAALVGILGVGLAPPRGLRATALAGAGVGLALMTAVAGVWVGLEDPQAFALEHRHPRRAGGVVLDVPLRLAVIESRQEESSPWPVYPGLHDRLAQRVGDRVQIVVTPATSGPDDPSALLRIDPALSHELVEYEASAPEAWAEACAQVMEPAEQERLRTTVVRRNGQDVGIVIERPLSDAQSVVLVASPTEALDHDASLYAAILADARLEQR